MAAPLLSPSARQRQQQEQLRQALVQKDGGELRHLSERLVHRQGPAALRAMVAKLAQSPEEVAFWWAQMQAPQAPAGPQVLPAVLAEVSGDTSGKILREVPVGFSEAKETKEASEVNKSSEVNKPSEVNKASEFKDVNRVIPGEFKLDVRVDVGSEPQEGPVESGIPLGLEVEVKAGVQVELHENIGVELQEDIQEDIQAEVQLEFSQEPQAKVKIDSQFASQAADQPLLSAEQDAASNQVVPSNQVLASNQGDSVETPTPTPAPGSSSAIARGQKLRGWLPSWDGPIRKAS